MTRYLVFVGIEDVGEPGSPDFEPLSIHLYDLYDSWDRAVRELAKRMAAFLDDSCLVCKDHARQALRVLLSRAEGSDFEDEIDGTTYMIKEFEGELRRPVDSSHDWSLS